MAKMLSSKEVMTISWSFWSNMALPSSFERIGMLSMMARRMRHFWSSDNGREGSGKKEYDRIRNCISM